MGVFLVETIDRSIRSRRLWLAPRERSSYEKLKWVGSTFAQPALRLCVQQNALEEQRSLCGDRKLVGRLNLTQRIQFLF